MSLAQYASPYNILKKNTFYLSLFYLFFSSKDIDIYLKCESCNLNRH